MQLRIKNKKHYIGQKAIAIYFIGCLLLAITPRETLHALFANHTDSNFITYTSTQSTQLSKETIHCHFDAVFTANGFFTVPTVSLKLPVFAAAQISDRVIADKICTNFTTTYLRGPPALDEIIFS